MDVFAARTKMNFSNTKRMRDYILCARKPCHVPGCGLLSVMSFYRA